MIDETRIIKLRENGMRAVDIAHSLHINLQEVQRIIREHPETEEAFRKNNIAQKFGMVPYEEVVRVVCADYKSGMSMRDIADKYGVSDIPVRTILYEARLSPSGRMEDHGIRSLDDRKKKVGELRKQGLTYPQIAKETGLCVTCVRHLLKSQKLNGRLPRTDVSRETEKYILRSFKRRKKTTAQLARELNLRQSTVYNIVRKHGLSMSEEARKKRDDELYHDFLSGMAIPSIAKKYRVQERSVYRIVQKKQKAAAELRGKKYVDRRRKDTGTEDEK